MPRPSLASVPIVLLALVAGSARAEARVQGSRDRFAVVQTQASPRLLEGTSDVWVQDFTAPDLGELRAAVFLVSGATDDGTAPPTARLSIGFCDADGRQAFRSALAVDDAAFQQTGHQKGPTAVIGVPATHAVNAYAARGAFQSVVPGGVRIRWTRTLRNDTSPASIEPYRITCLLIGGTGDGTRAFVGARGSAVAGRFEAEMGFEPDLVVLLGFFGAINVELRGDGAYGSLGFAANRPGLPQAAFAYDFPDDPVGPPHHPPAEPSESYACVRTDRAVSLRDAMDGEENELRVTGFTSTGFEYEQNDFLGFYYLAVDLADARRVDVVVEDLPASTGAASFERLGFRPEVVLAAASLVTTTDAMVGTAEGAEEDVGAHGYAILSSAGQGACSVSNADGLLLGTVPANGEERSVTRSAADTRALLVLPNRPSTDGPGAIEASLRSMRRRGFELELAQARPGRMVVLAIERYAAPHAAGAPGPATGELALQLVDVAARRALGLPPLSR